MRLPRESVSRSQIESLPVVALEQASQSEAINTAARNILKIAKCPGRKRTCEVICQVSGCSACVWLRDWLFEDTEETDCGLSFLNFLKPVLFCAPHARTLRRRCKAAMEIRR